MPLSLENSFFTWIKHFLCLSPTLTYFYIFLKSTTLRCLSSFCFSVTSLNHIKVFLKKSILRFSKIYICFGEVTFPEKALIDSWKKIISTICKHLVCSLATKLIAKSPAKTTFLFSFGTFERRSVRKLLLNLDNLWWVARFGTNCTILKRWKNTHGGVLLFIKLQAKSLQL